MSHEEQITQRVQFVPDHSQVDAYLASLRAAGVHIAIAVFPGLIPLTMGETPGAPGAVAPRIGAGELDPQDANPSVEGASLHALIGPSRRPVAGETAATEITRRDEQVAPGMDRTTRQFARPSSALTLETEMVAGSSGIQSSNGDLDEPAGDFRERLQDEVEMLSMRTGFGSPRIGASFASGNDIRRDTEQSALDIYQNDGIPAAAKPGLANQRLRGGILQEQNLSESLLHNLQPEQLDSINQQATSGPGTADVSAAMKKAADDIAEMRTLLSNGVNTAEIIKQLLQALKAM